MAATGVSSAKSEKSTRTFVESLSAAFFEWVLIFLLFVIALLSYLTTRFAHYCGLQTPCLLCSRLDHILGKERLGFYWDMICCRHKSEISSLVLCHAHSKLVDVHGICENCLFSFATINKSNAETYRLLVGKLGADSDSGSSEEEEFSSEGTGIKKSSTKLCSCCNKPWIARGPTQTLMQTTSIMSRLAELDVPLSGVIGALKDIGDGSSKRIERGISNLSHVGYMELKISSDTESEVPFSDDEEVNSLFQKKAVLGENSGVKPSKVDPLINVSSRDSVVNLEEQSSVEQSDDLVVNLEEKSYVEQAKDSVVNLGEPSSVERAKDSVVNLGEPSSVERANDSVVNLEEQSAVGMTSASLPEAKVDAGEGQKDESVRHHVGRGLEEINWQTFEVEDKDDSEGQEDANDEGQKDKSVRFDVGHGLEEINWQNSEIENKDANEGEEDAMEGQKDEPVRPDVGRGLEEINRQNSEIEDKDANEGQQDAIGSQKDESVRPDVGHEINWQNSESKDKDASASIAELISFDDFPSDTTDGATFEDKDANEGQQDAIGSQKDESFRPDVGHEINWQNSESKDKDASASIAELISFDDFPSDTTDGATFEKLSPQTSFMETNEAPGKESEETLKVDTEPSTTAEKPVEANLVSSDSSPRMANLLDLGDAYKLAVGNRGRQLSGALTEQWLSKDSSSRVSEDLKNLLSQLAAPRGTDQSSAPDLSPKISLNGEDSLKTLDSLQKRISLERNESNLSQDGSLVSDIEGESTIDRLKRQVEHDRRALSVLYKELEEERNASAISANQAMAMITRLQEEKATLQMEALQYLRMMEEQAEYDMEALQKSNDLLADREKEIQDLEDELEFYRMNFGDDSPMPENFDTHLKAESTGTSRLKDSAIGLEDERLQLLESLKKLEKKFGLSSGPLSRDVSSGSHEELDTSPDNDSNNDNCAGKSSSDTSGGNDLTSIKNEVSYLQKRLEALEEDRNFLERAVKHLRIGEDGVRFVQDIASRLQAIRSTE